MERYELDDWEIYIYIFFIMIFDDKMGWILIIWIKRYKIFFFFFFFYIYKLFLLF